MYVCTRKMTAVTAYCLIKCANARVLIRVRVHMSVSVSMHPCPTPLPLFQASSCARGSGIECAAPATLRPVGRHLDSPSPELIASSSGTTLP